MSLVEPDLLMGRRFPWKHGRHRHKKPLECLPAQYMPVREGRERLRLFQAMMARLRPVDKSNPAALPYLYFYDLQFLWLSGLGVLFVLYHVFFRSPITDRVWKGTGSLKFVQILRQLILLCSSNIRDFKQQRRQRQRKRHLKINIWETVTILGLLLLPRILYCWQSTLRMDW